MFSVESNESHHGQLFGKLSSPTEIQKYFSQTKDIKFGLSNFSKLDTRSRYDVFILCMNQKEFENYFESNICNYCKKKELIFKYAKGCNNCILNMACGDSVWLLDNV